MVKGVRDSGGAEDIWERRVPAPPGATDLNNLRRGSHPQHRNKPQGQRKPLTNNVAQHRPGQSRTLPRKPPPHPYNTISAPHRLVDPRDEPPAGILRRSASKDSVRSPQSQQLTRSLCSLQASPTKNNNAQTKLNNGPVSASATNGPEILPLAPKVPPYPPPRTESTY